MKRSFWLKVFLVSLTLILTLSLASCFGVSDDGGESGRDDNGGNMGNPCQYDHVGIEERVIQHGTCTQNGIYERWCRVCGEVVDRHEEPAVGHAWEYVEEISPATCQSPQIIKESCYMQTFDGTVCGETREIEGEPASAHVYEFNEEYLHHMCTTCNTPEIGDDSIFVDNVLYEIISENTLGLDKVFVKDLTTFTVPETVEGKTVVTVHANAFDLSPGIQEVKLPKTLTHIDDPLTEFLFSLGVTEYENGYYYAGGDSPYTYFFGMIDKSVTGEFILHPDVICIFGDGFMGSDISSVEFPENVAHFGWNTFRGCSNITEVTLPDGITGISTYMFSGCPIKSLVLPESVTYIHSNAFEYSGIESIDLSNVTYIGDKAFYGAQSLETVVLSDKLELIHYDVFRDCQKLSVVIPEHITNFNGDCFLFTKEVSVTVKQFVGNERYFMGARNIILRGEGIVPTGSISGWEQLQSLTFDGVTRVMPYAVTDCPNLKSVTFGDGISRVEAYTVFNCESLDTLVFSDDVLEIADELFLKSIVGTTSTISNQNNFTVTTENGCTYYSNGDNPYYVLLGVSGVSGSLVLPEGVTFILDGIFDEADNISSLTLPDTVRYISADGITSAWDTAIASNINGTYYVGSATNPYMVLVKVESGYGSYTVNDGVKFILPYAFNGTSVNAIEMGNNVLQIKKNALGVMTSVILPDRLASIGNEFAPAETAGNQIGAINAIPEGLLYLNIGAKFKLTPDKLFINEGTYFIGKNAFADDTAFTEYENAYYVGTKDNPYYALIKADSDITELKIHEDTVLIAQYALSECDSLVSVTIPDSVQFINTYAFYGMSSLEVVTMGAGVIEIGYSAFGSCSRLERAYIGENVRIIRGSAFEGCTNLKSIFIPGSVFVAEGFITECENIYCGMRQQPKYFNTYWCASVSASSDPMVHWNAAKPY